MTCREVIEFLAEYLDGLRPEFEEHLIVCASCRAYLATYKVTIRAVRDLDAEDEDAPEELIRAILDARR